MRIGEKWLPYRQAEGFFTVHSVFNRVVNVSFGRELLSVAAVDAGGSSAFLSLADGNVNFGMSAGDRCVLRAGRLQMARHTVNFSDAPLWKGPIHKEYRHGKIKNENIAAFKAVLDRKAAPQSAWRYITADGESRFSGLNAIRELRENPFRARDLIGLGLGLTPAGDDILVGFLAAVNHLSENRAYIDTLHSVIADSLDKTTDISARILDNALDRDYHEFIQNCIRDLCEREKEEVYISTATLINIGATSGSDIACGIYFGIIDS